MTVTRAAAAVLLLLATLTACGGGEPSDGSRATTPLTRAEVRSALLTAEDLGPTFRATGPDESDQDLGCLKNLATLDGLTQGLPADRAAETDFEPSDGAQAPAVFSAVATFPTTGAATAVLDEFQAGLGGCTEIDQTDDEGFRVQLEVSMDEKRSGPRASAQVNLVAAGTGTTDGVAFPFAVRVTAVRVANHVALVGFLNLARPVTADSERVVELALRRLAAAADGRTLRPGSLDLRALTEDELMESAQR